VVRRLPHGYTNQTTGDGTVVRKVYDGPDAHRRRDRERTVLSDLAGRIPVPPVIDDPASPHDPAGDASLTLGFVPGTHGQDLLGLDAATDVAESVLGACGTVLRRIHELESRPVLVHGDFGPNNVLLDPATFEVTAVLDWEFSHAGEPVEDLAWCEWTVRTHHPSRVDALGAFFDAYGGGIPPWPVRHQAMLDACDTMLDFCTCWDPAGGGVSLWQRRRAATAAWRG
jgi:tRNA A-37 threonylcarbamoyl transferase component Bud32